MAMYPVEELWRIPLPHSKIAECEMIERQAFSRIEGKWIDMPICRVLFESSFGEGSLIRSELWMPSEWNGMLLGIGNGGFAGVLRASYLHYARMGYAVVETDMGTSLYLEGKLTRATPHLFKDSGTRSTHTMTVVAKILIEAFYGRPAERAYFMGSSAGGKQAIAEMQRFPEDYDGIIAGVPSNNALNLITYFLWCYVHLTTREGVPLIGTALASRLSDEAARFLAERGGAATGSDYVEYSHVGEDTVDAFLAHLAVAMPDLTEAQTDALRAVYHGPVNKKNGKRIYAGMPIGSEIDCGYMRDSDGPREFDFPWFSLYFGEDFVPHDFDFADDYEAFLCDVGPDFTFNDPDLSAFRARGGHMIIFSGISDFWGPWPEAAHYYNGVCRHLGGDEAAAEVVRLFLLPGKGHNIKGRGVNAWWADEERTPLLDAIRAWCEEGKAPDFLVGAHLDDIEKGDRGEQVRFMRRIPRYRGIAAEGRDYPYACHPDYAMPGREEAHP